MLDRVITAFAIPMVMVIIIFVMVVIAIGLDLWSGIKKAKARGEYRSSTMYRKTVDKFAQYFNMLFVLLVIDVLQMVALWGVAEQGGSHLPLLPLFTFIGGIGVGFIECKSIYEDNDAKQKAKVSEVAKMVKDIAKDKDAQKMLSVIFGYITDEKEVSNESK